MTIDRASREEGAASPRRSVFTRLCSQAAQPWRGALALLTAAAAMLAGCASTQFRSAGQMPDEPLCQRPTENVSAVVLWGVQWRPDQKEPALREAAARRGIETFFADSNCFVNARVLQAINDRS